ncbi:MAG TPA: ABC transporter permease subunit [Candidatus Binatia bacterium]
MIPRPSRIAAVARYEMRCHMKGRQALRLLGVASALLLPAGLIPTPHIRPPALGTPPPVRADTRDPSFIGPPMPPKIHVRGDIPSSLEWRFEHSDDAPFEFRGSNPLVVVAPEVPVELRSALETLAGPKRLEVRDFLIPGRLPGRSLLIAILAVSLLTGPLADALPGERARRTLEVLLTAGITRGELVGGKWLAWTLSASLTAAVAAALAIWRGVQVPGWWLAGLPLFIGSSVAFGLWLVRLVDDVVGGSAAPMRVLPVAAGGMAALARVISESSPTLAAAVPLGGPLLVAADLFPTGGQLAAAAVGSAAFIVAILIRTGADLDRIDTAAPTRWGAVGLSGVAVLLWWLTVAGPAVWSAGPSGSTSDMVTPIDRSMLVGGVALLACAIIALARETPGYSATLVRPTRVSAVVALAVTIAVSTALAVAGAIPAAQTGTANPAIVTMLERLREGAVPSAMFASPGQAVAALVAVFGQVVLFRSIVQNRLGWIAASVLWCIAMSPTTPWMVLPASLALGAIALRCGWIWALVAQLAWSAACSSAGSQFSGVLAIEGQMMALVISLAALRPFGRDPSLHQL